MGCSTWQPQHSIPTKYKVNLLLIYPNKSKYMFSIYRLSFTVWLILTHVYLCVINNISSLRITQMEKIDLATNIMSRK